MKSIAYKGLLFLSLFALVSLTSCREKQTEEEKLIEEMKADGADIETTYGDDGDMKTKMETDDKTVKIKKDADGDTKIKIDTDDN